MYHVTLNHSALFLGLHGRAERFPINETRGSAVGFKQREGHISLHEAKSPSPSFPPSHLTTSCAYHGSPWWMEKFHAFLLLQRFLPGIQNHRSSRRKQVTGPQLPSELGCPNFPQNMVQQSWPRTGLGEHRQERGGSTCSPGSGYRTGVQQNQSFM